MYPKASSAMFIGITGLCFHPSSSESESELSPSPVSYEE